VCDVPATELLAVKVGAGGVKPTVPGNPTTTTTTTTTLPGQLPPGQIVAPPPGAAGPAGGELAFTGSRSDDLAIVGFAALAIGAAFFMGSRRRRTQRA
jgi:LPXTG-motif cell wall-anchored protein